MGAVVVWIAIPFGKNVFELCLVNSVSFLCQGSVVTYLEKQFKMVLISCSDEEVTILNEELKNIKLMSLNLF